ncbi:MAG: hypothetical protein WCX79_01490 [Candidatus Paceibacterota bacterium]|jgi:hypothetical protein
MDITIYVAKILGVYFVVSGVFLLLKGKTISHILKDFFQHPAVIYLTGVILLFLSTAYLIGHNIWNGTWQTLITVFVWLIFFKGLSYIFIPEAFNENSIKKYKGFYYIYGLIAIIVGIVLFMLPNY